MWVRSSTPKFRRWCVNLASAWLARKTEQAASGAAQRVEEANHSNDQTLARIMVEIRQTRAEAASSSVFAEGFSGLTEPTAIGAGALRDAGRM